nr:MAG TPA: tail tape measure protein [Caudoviricetes sp.]
MNDGSVIIEVEFNTDNARKQYQAFGNEAAQQLDNKIGKSKAFNSLSEQSTEFAKKASLSILAVGTAVAGFSIKAAADMQAMDAQFSQVFGNLEKNAQSSIDSISKETNILPNRLKPAFTSMAAFAKTTGMDTADALDLTSRATKAAADSAAFYDKSIGEVSESLQSYLKGNYENDAALGISSTETTRNAAANKLYGKSFNDLSEAQKQLTLLQMVEDGNKLSGALGQAAREGGGLENVIGNMKQAITDLGAAFGAPLLDPFLAIVQKISGAMAKLAEVFRENPALVYVVVGAVTTLAAALGAAYLAANNFAKLKAIMSGVKAGFMALTSPVSLVVLAIGALVTAFVYFYNTSDTFREKVNGAVKTLQSFMAPVGDVIEGIKLLAQAFKAIVFNDFSVSLSDLHDQFVKLFPESLWNGMTSFAQSTKGIVQGISTLAKAFKAIALDDFSVSVTNLKEDFLEVFPESLWNGMTKIALGIRSLINGFKSGEKSIDPFGIALKILQSVFLGLLGPIGLFIKAFELIAKALGGGDVSKGIDKIIDAFDSLASGLQSNGPKVGRSAGKAIEGILTAIAGALPGIIAGGLQIVAAIVSGIAQGLPSLAMSASQLIMAFTAAMLILVPQIALSATAIIVALLAALTAGLPQIIVAGGSLILALLEGITQQLPALIESAATLIVTWLTSLTSHLPEIITAGMSLLIAVIQGITQKLPDLIIAVGQMIVAFLTALSSQLPQIVIAGATLIVNFINGLATMMPSIVAAAINLVVQFLGGISSNLGRVITAGVSIVVAVIDGIANNIGRIIEAGMNLVDQTVAGILRAQDRLFQAGITLVNGLADNIRGNQGAMSDAGANLLNALIGALPGGALINNGIALVDGLLSGLMSGFENVKRTVSGWADTIASLKGPIPYDKKVLIENGLALVSGLREGLLNGFSEVKSNVATWANELQEGIESEIDSNYFNDLVRSIPTEIPAMNALMNGVLSPELVSGVDRYSNASNRAAEVYKSKEFASGSNISDGTVFQIPTHVQIDSETIVKKTFKLTYQQIKQMQFTKGRLRGEIDNAGSDLW